MSDHLSAAEIAEQEDRLVLERFDHDDAWWLGSLLVQLARERQLPIAIDIHRNGQQLFHAALPGSEVDNDRWVERKSRVVARYGRSSYRVGRECSERGQTFEAWSRLDSDRYAAHGGAFPIRVDGAGLIGAVVVSGLPQRDDHELVVEALTALKERRPTSSTGT